MEFSNNELKTAAQSYFRAQLKANYELWIANDSQCGALILLIWNFVFIQICPFFKDLQDMQIKIDFFWSVLKTQMALCGSWKTLTDKNKSRKSYRKMNCQSDLQTFNLLTDQSISYKCIKQFRLNLPFPNSKNKSTSNVKNFQIWIFFHILTFHKVETTLSCSCDW